MKIVTKLLVLAGIAMATGSLSVTLADAELADNALDTAEGVARVDDYLKNVETLTAHFRMSLFDPDMQLVQESFGTLKVKRPGRFRWDYVEPYEQLILSDGEKLWMYDADLEQASVKSLGASLSASPAMLLSGSGNIAEGFDVLGVYDADDILWVSLAPKSDDTDFERFNLGFEGDKLRFMELADRLDQLTQIEFSHVRQNLVLDDGIFTFEPPDGVDVIGDS